MSGISPYAINFNKYKKDAYGKKRYYQPRSGTYQKRTRKFRPGYNRTSGYYGRFNNNNDGELKFLDSTVDLGNVPQTMSTHNPMEVPVGSGPSERDGRKIVIKSFHFRGSVYLKETNAYNECFDIIKFALVLDTQCNGAGFGGADLYTNNNLYAFRNLTNSNRFRILKSFYVHLRSVNSESGVDSNQPVLMGRFSPVLKKIAFNVKCNIPIEYSGNEGTLGEVRSNFLTMCTWAAQPSRSSIEGTMRIRYVG